MEEGEQTEPPEFHVIYILSIGPSYVALVPQVEEVEEGEQTKPQEFHVIYILSRTQLCSSGSSG